MFLAKLQHNLRLESASGRFMQTLPTTSATGSEPQFIVMQSSPRLRGEFSFRPLK